MSLKQTCTYYSFHYTTVSCLTNAYCGILQQEKMDTHTNAQTATYTHVPDASIVVEGGIRFLNVVGTADVPEIEAVVIVDHDHLRESQQSEQLSAFDMLSHTKIPFTRCVTTTTSQTQNIFTTQQRLQQSVCI